MESADESSGSSSSSDGSASPWWAKWLPCGTQSKDDFGLKHAHSLRQCEEGHNSAELQAMIEQRDSLNASIEEHMRRQNLELPLVTDPTSKVALAFLVPEVESQWRNEGCQDQIVVGSLFLALCELLLRISSLWKDLRHGCGLKGLMASMALKAGVIYNGCAFVILVPFALWNTRLKSRRLLLALTIFAYLDRILASMPLLHYACGRGRDTSPQCETFPSKKDCQMMEYHRFHVQMLSVMAQVLVLPEYRYCSYMWIWIFLATLVSSVFVANEEIRSVLTGTRDRVLLTTEGKLDVEDAKNEFFVRLLLLSLVQMVANRKKCTMEEQNRALFLASNKNKRVSMSMFKVLEFMVPGFVILPMLQLSQNSSTSLSYGISYRFDCASVLFMAFDDFESIVQQSTPPEILQFLNKFYNRFDVLCVTKSVIKIETVAEEYVCAVGVAPDSDPADSSEELGNLIDFAKEVLSYEGASFKMGIHSGPVVAGVVGSKLPRYRLFGNTVNMAARMMQKGLPGELQFGEATKALLPPQVKVTPRGQVEMKGQGKVNTYLLDHKECYRHVTVVQMSTVKTGKALFRALIAGKKAAEGGFQGDRSVSRWWSCFCAFCPGWNSFPKELEVAYKNWYFQTVFTDNFSAIRLQRQTLFMFILTVVETGYMLFMSEGFATVPNFFEGLGKLENYFGLRLAVIVLSLGMSLICPPVIMACRHDCSSSWKVWFAWLASQAAHLTFVTVLMLSYMLLPSYAAGQANGKSQELTVPDYVVALMALPVYAAVMMSYQQDFLTSVVYIATFGVMVLLLRFTPGIDQNGYPTGGVTFLGYSMIFAVKAYMGERSLREQFKARHAIDEAKSRIEDILDTMMPQPVMDELQRLPAGSSALSHHYHRATLVQSDLIGFTRMASLKPPEAVVKAVSDLFGLFDGLADEYGIYKVETVGDAYIAGQAEPPLTLDNYPPNVIRFGLKMIGATKKWSSDSDETIGVRVGVHSGECIGGIVGIDKQRYHLFGQLIHQLELLESTAPENGLQVSSSCKAAVEAAWASDTHTHREENLSVSSCLRFDFVERPEKHLVTSKGEVHQYAEVGGRTFLVWLPPS